MRLLNGTGDLEEARCGISTKWREGDDESDGKEGAEDDRFYTLRGGPSSQRDVFVVTTIAKLSTDGYETMSVTEWCQQ